MKVAKIKTRTDMPETKNKVGRVFLMVILSEFQQIYSNKNSPFRKKRKLRFAIFATVAICEIARFAMSQIKKMDFEPIL